MGRAEVAAQPSEASEVEQAVEASKAFHLEEVEPLEEASQEEAQRQVKVLVEVERAASLQERQRCRRTGNGRQSTNGHSVFRQGRRVTVQPHQTGQHSP